MKTNRTILFVLSILVAATSYAQQKQQAVHDHDHGSFKPKFGQVVVEFPGHKFAMEIIEAEKTVGEGKDAKKIEVVRAFVTDAHFEPVAVELKDIKLQFVVNGKGKLYALPLTKDEQAKKDEPKPVMFELADPDLVKLVCEGWKGDAFASMTVGWTPYKAKLVRVAKDKDAHKGHNH